MGDDAGSNIGVRKTLNPGPRFAIPVGMRESVAILAAAVLLILHASPAQTQQATADGVQLLLRGDYSAAVDVLRPLAEGTDPDPIAQFFLALMYEHRLGVNLDLVRACRLYERAAVPENPFRGPSLGLGTMLRGQLSPPGRDRCALADSVDFGNPKAGPVRSGSPVSVETATAVDAIVRGDYARAVEILRPLAENRNSRDVTAKLYMGMLHQEGRGVARDDLRACALYSRAAMAPPRSRGPSGIFESQALSLAKWFHIIYGSNASSECSRLANSGLN
jgi:TPR repeat protein